MVLTGFEEDHLGHHGTHERHRVSKAGLVTPGELERITAMFVRFMISPGCSRCWGRQAFA